VLPGESYGPDDVALFSELWAALRAAELRRSSVDELIALLEVARAGRTGLGLARAAQVVPELGVLELIVNKRAAPLRKAEGMLLMLLLASAGGSRASGIAYHRADARLGKADHER
jgi:N-methylhydantoinase A/oxoprolinase/acetone carboxylase beta subunit